MKPTLRLTTLALLASLLSAPPVSAAQYRETFDPGKSPDEVMFGILGFGEGETWSGRLADGQYVLTNRTDPSAVQYYYLEAPPGGTFGSLRDATVSVEVSGDFGSDPSGAGLVYRFDPATRTYWAFALTRDGYGVFKRDRGGFQRVMAGGSDAIRPGEANRLTVRPGPDGAAQFLVNDEVVGAAGGSDIAGAGVGLLALGAGSFRFDDFTISTGDGAALDRAAPERAAAPPPADPRDWAAHEEPGRFALRHPPGWRVEAAADTGVVGLRGPADEEVRIWPFFVRARIDPSSAEAVLGRLAHQLAPAARWDRARAAGGSGLTAAGRDGAGRAAVTGLHWTPAAEGTAGTFYMVAAPEGAFRAEEPVFAAILESFRPLGGAEAPGGRGPAVAYTRWTDPREGAFALDVPRDWATEGGLFRVAAVDVRPSVRATSPDGAVTVFIGDPDLPPFVTPNPMLTATGFPEGSWYAPQGVAMFVKRHTPGAAFAREFVGWKFGAEVEGLAVERVRDRPDLSEQINALYRQYAVPGFTTRLDTGEASFAGRAGGRSVSGYVLAGTLLSASQGFGADGGVWSVQYLYGFTAPAARAGEAAAILAHMAASSELNPEWVRMQQGLTLDVARINREAAQHVADTINEAYEQRQASWDEVHRRFSNHITDRVDVVDPDTGETFKVESGSNYYWVDHSGTVVGTDLHANPDSLWFREMVQLP